MGVRDRESRFGLTRLATVAALVVGALTWTAAPGYAADKHVLGIGNSESTAVQQARSGCYDAGYSRYSVVATGTYMGDKGETLYYARVRCF